MDVKENVCDKRSSIARSEIIEDKERLHILPTGRVASVEAVVGSLKADKIVLIRSLNIQEADQIIEDTASGLGLLERLELQACFASIGGHRVNLSKYFMSVNFRSDYQVVTPHSEGNSFSAMQLAAFYCYENSTDGGETIAFNIDNESGAWRTLKERRVRAQLANPKRKLTAQEVAYLRGKYFLTMPQDVITDSCEICGELPSPAPDIRLFEVLVQPKKTYSIISGQERYVYWDSISTIDRTSVHEYLRLLDSWQLLKLPFRKFTAQEFDPAFKSRVWESGVKFESIFSAKMTHKMVAGDFLIFNNMTWAHSVSNWSKDSGTRKVGAAFA